MENILLYGPVICPLYATPIWLNCIERNVVIFSLSIKKTCATYEQNILFFSYYGLFSENRFYNYSDESMIQNENEDIFSRIWRKMVSDSINNSSYCSAMLLDVRIELTHSQRLFYSFFCLFFFAIYRNHQLIHQIQPDAELYNPISKPKYRHLN